MSGDILQVPDELVLRYATSAPRYTSYPTTVDWRNNLDLGAYGDRLRRAARENGPISIYVHVPFCEELCLFCGCNVHITRSREKGSDYLRSLALEVAAVAGSGIGRRPFTQLHVGGGTPTFLDEAELDRLARMLFQSFAPGPDAEIGIEADPRVTRPGQLEVLRGHGFNRLSIGVQDFDPRVQAAVKRHQSEAETEAVVVAARALGYRSVNIDLMYGLPGQTGTGFARTLDAVLHMRPERLALFHYAHVPWLKRHQNALPLSEVPDAATKLRIFNEAAARLMGAGYEYLGLDHFALPGDELAEARRDGTLRRNFMGYGTRAGADLVGLGVSAIGEVDGAYWQNDPDPAGYSRRVASGGFAVHRGHELDRDDELRRDLIMSLMCEGRVGIRRFEARLGAPFPEVFSAELAGLAPLVADGLVRIDEEAIEVTPRGQRFLRNVAVVFDRYYRERVRTAGVPSATFSRTL